MAIHHLLWACPQCRTVDGLRGRDSCRACGTAFQRHAGAAIRALLPDGTPVVRSPAEWVDRLPDVADLLAEGKGGGVIRQARVQAREVTGSDQVHGEAGYLNRIELYGPNVAGTLELGLERLIYAPDGATPRIWALEALRAIQASSSTLQVRARGAPLVSFRFVDDSVYLWELLLAAALRDLYRRTGRGEIVEFQPRIETR